MSELLDLPEQIIAGRRAEIEAAAMGVFFGLAIAEADALIPPELIAGPAMAVYHRDSGTTFDVTIGYPVSAEPHGTTLDIVRLPAGPALREVHMGQYQGLGAAYDRLQAALTEHGAVRTMSWEVYRTGPRDDPDSSTWRTEVYAPAG